MACVLVIPDSLEEKPNELHREFALRVLEYNIITFNLLPGQVISEYELATELGISRSPIHDALIELCKKSLATIIPQVGTKISLIDRKKVEAVWFLRMNAELHMVDQVVDRIKPQGLSLLHTNLEDQKDALQQEDYFRFLELDNAFHDVLFSQAGLGELNEQLKPGLPVYNRVRMLMFQYFDAQKTIQDHSNLLACLEKRNVVGVKSTLKTHLEIAVLKQLEALEQKFPDYFTFENNKLY